MSEILYVAASGAKQTLLAQAINSNNLANVNTVGFRADLINAVAADVSGEDLPASAYAQAGKLGSNFSPGTVISTGRELDIAIQGEGWIAVQTADGSEAYTRAGDLKLTPNGLLQTARGDSVLGNGGPIAIPPAEKIEIGGDGTISIRGAGQTATALAQLDRIKLVKPDETLLSKGEDGLFRLAEEATADADSSVKVTAGAVESSNVNSVDAMINIITLARQFEMQMKLVDTAEQIADASAQNMQLS